MAHKYNTSISVSLNLLVAFTYGDMGHTFQGQIFHVFHNGWMDCRDAYYAVLC